MGETDTDTWLAVLALEPCEACPRPGVLGAAVGGRLAGDVVGCWGCRAGVDKANTAAGTAPRKEGGALIV